jgi:transposase
MEKDANFQNIKDDARDELRICAIKLIKTGISQKETATIIGCHYNTVNIWWKKYKAQR